MVSEVTSGFELIFESERDFTAQSNKVMSQIHKRILINNSQSILEC
jgi:hypothetical protein